MKHDNKAIKRLRKLGACQPAIHWVRTQPSFKAAWFNCEKDEWLDFLIGELAVRGLISKKLFDKSYSLYMYGTETIPEYETIVFDTQDVIREGIPYETIRKAMARIAL